MYAAIRLHSNDKPPVDILVRNFVVLHGTKHKYDACIKIKM